MDEQVTKLLEDIKFLTTALRVYGEHMPYCKAVIEAKEVETCKVCNWPFNLHQTDSGCQAPYADPSNIIIVRHPMAEPTKIHFQCDCGLSALIEHKKMPEKAEQYLLAMHRCFK